MPRLLSESILRVHRNNAQLRQTWLVANRKYEDSSDIAVRELLDHIAAQDITLEIQDGELRSLRQELAAQAKVLADAKECAKHSLKLWREARAEAAALAHMLVSIVEDAGDVSDEAIATALSGTAGKALLDRLECLEAVATRTTEWLENWCRGCRNREPCDKSDNCLSMNCRHARALRIKLTALDASGKRGA